MNTTREPVWVYQRLYKKLNQPEKVFTVMSEDYADPILWTDIEGGYWIDNEPNRVRQ